MSESADEAPGVARIDFSEDEAASLGRLASALRLVGLLQILLAGILVVFALLGLVNALGRGLAGAPVRLVLALLAFAWVAAPVWQGALLREAGESLGRVAGADEDDQEYLASTFRRLRAVFVIELVLALWSVYDALD